MTAEHNELERYRRFVIHSNSRESDQPMDEIVLSKVRGIQTHAMYCVSLWDKSNPLSSAVTEYGRFIEFGEAESIFEDLLVSQYDCRWVPSSMEDGRFYLLSGKKGHLEVYGAGRPIGFPLTPAKKVSSVKELIDREDEQDSDQASADRGSW